MKFNQYSPTEKKWLDEGLVDLSSLDVSYDLIYASSHNVFNQKLYVDFEKPFGTELLFQKLKSAVVNLEVLYPEYQLIVYDALRTVAIQRAMWDAYSGEDRAKYIAAPDKRSIHNYGMAVDVSIIERKNKVPLDMGCPIDTFADIADHFSDRINEVQKFNRNLLRELMTKASFYIYEHEWWHYEALTKKELSINEKFY